MFAPLLPSLKIRGCGLNYALSLELEDVAGTVDDLIAVRQSPTVFKSRVVIMDMFRVRSMLVEDQVKII